MANSNQLRENLNQHIPKNTESKRDDKILCQAMTECAQYLNIRFAEYMQDYMLSFEKALSVENIINLVKSAGIQKEYDTTFVKRELRPDGGVIFLHKKSDKEFLRIILISEAKKQGTNIQRKKEGKSRQAIGNAIERLGKNLIGVKTALNHEAITPFVCFGWGCDFEENYDSSSFTMSKISILNELYELNRTYVFKKDGALGSNSFAPVSMYFREEPWTKDEMVKILREVGETSLRYYLF